MRKFVLIDYLFNCYLFNFVITFNYFTSSVSVYFCVCCVERERVCVVVGSAFLRGTSVFCAAGVYREWGRDMRHCYKAFFPYRNNRYG